ncbi:MAG TPA: hexose kinase [Clostridia bacterium]|nr:hexose kinase [Clostridia bacterium]
MILCIGTTPAVQRVMQFRKLELDAVNRAVTTVDGVAGKSVNVAKVLRAFGQRVVATGFLGGDRGAVVAGELERLGVRLDFVSIAARTRQCTTVIDQGGGTITELVEESPPATRANYESLGGIIQRHMANSRAVVMSGTLAPGGSPDFYRNCTEWAHGAGALPVVDAQGVSLMEALKARPGLVKPNRVELAATVGHPLQDEPGVMRAMEELHTMGAERVVVTAGKDSTLAFDGKFFWRITSPSITAVNPIGSGDSVTAALVWRLLQGDDLGEACSWGSAAGAANALSLMAGELELKEVERLRKLVQVEKVG